MSIKNFRIVALVEATSFLILLVATAIKYGADGPDLAPILGPIHGVLFLAYLVECSLSQLMGAMKNQAHLTHEWLTMAADLLDRQREWMPRDAPGM